MMRKTLLILAIALGFLLAPALFQQPAEAGVRWSIGSAFSVGGFDFAFVFGDPYGPYADHRFYRTHRALHYPGYRCHNGCSYRAGYYYHHPNCSIVRHHFRRHSFYPERHLGFAPWYYGGSVRYDRHRHDYRRYDRYRYDRHRNRYDKHRYDRYRHDRSRYDRHRYDRNRGHRDRSYGDRNRHDRRRNGSHGDYGRDDHRRGDRNDSGRRRGSDTRSRGRRQ